MTGLPTTQALIDLADAVVTAGFDAHRPAVTELAATARRLGVRPVLADIVVDLDAPRPVRERALGRLVVAMSATAARVDGADLAGTATAA